VSRFGVAAPPLTTLKRGSRGRDAAHTGRHVPERATRSGPREARDEGVKTATTHATNHADRGRFEPFSTPSANARSFRN
jgi:hypothetical protein